MPDRLDKGFKIIVWKLLNEDVEKVKKMMYEQNGYIHKEKASKETKKKCWSWKVQ